MSNFYRALHSQVQMYALKGIAKFKLNMSLTSIPNTFRIINKVVMTEIHLKIWGDVASETSL